MAATTHLRKTDKLFVCYGTAVLKQRLSNDGGSNHYGI